MPDEMRCDIAVVGAGPAGIAAAATAAARGASVCLIDQQALPGGQIWRHVSRVTLPRRARAWLDRLDASGARWLGGTAVVWATPDGRLALESSGGGVPMRADAIILATGARERWIPFPGWTLPDVVGVGGVQALVKNGLSVVGRRVVVAGTGPLVLPVAATLAAHGAELVVAEAAPPERVRRFALGLWRAPAKALGAARLRAAFARARYRTGTWVVRAEGASRVRSVTLTDGRREWTERCDLLACAHGLVPGVELPTLLGCAIEDGRTVVDETQRTSLPRVWAAGECTGIAGEDAALIEGEIAGCAALSAPVTPRLVTQRRRARAFARRVEEAFALRPELATLPDAATIICRCEDVRCDALDPAWSEREAKLYTRLAMGACQGRVCGAAMRALHGWAPNAVRPPVLPASVGALVDALPAE